jgi:hypothetical protein
MFKLLLDGKDLGCSSGSWWGLGDCFFGHRKNLESCWKIE